MVVGQLVFVILSAHIQVLPLRQAICVTCFALIMIQVIRDRASSIISCVIIEL